MNNTHHVTLTEQVSGLEPNLGLTIRRLRKCAKISQTDLGKIIDVHQTAVCRIEANEQGLTPHQLLQLSDFFLIGMDELLLGQINYWALAKHFGKKPPFPQRYLEMPYSKVREILPLIFFMNKLRGPHYTAKVLSELEMDNIYFVNPDQDIGINCHLDIARHCIENGLLTEKSFPKLTSFTHSSMVHGALDTVYKAQNSTLNLLQSFVLNQGHYESNFDYQIEELRKNSFDLSLTPRSHLKKVPYKDEILTDFLCRYKKDYLIQFPRYIHKKPAKLVEHQCHFRGAKSCIYTVSV